MILAKNLCLFAIGGCTYVVIELLFRGYSHYTMFLLAGVCFLAIGHLGKRFPQAEPGIARPAQRRHLHRRRTGGGAGL